MTWTQRPQRAPFTGTPASNDEPTIRLLGPFHVAHDTEGLLGDEGIVLFEATDPEAWVLEVWLVLQERFDNGFSENLVMGRTDDDLVNAPRETINVNPSGDTIDPYGGFITAPTPAGPWKIGAGLVVAMAVDDPPGVTAGQADIYALVAE